MRKRFIDAYVFQKFLQESCKAYCSYNDKGIDLVQGIAEQMCFMIDCQPTAYDTAEVVRAIKDESARCNMVDYLGRPVVVAETVIDIILNGGKI